MTTQFKDDTLLTDTKLIGDTLSGDKSAFGELVLRYEKKVFRLVYRIVNNSFDASDIVQETFIKAYKGLAYLKNPDRFQSWLFQIAKNHCTDWLRKRHDDLISIEKELAFDCLILPPTPDEILIENELHEQVMKAIAKLPEHSRKAVRMFYIESRSYAEIQKELGVKKGTLARWLYEARLQLGKASQHFGFVFASLLRKAFYQSLSTQAMAGSTAISITKCLIFSILFHAIIFSQIDFRHTDFASSHGQTYHGTFIEASFMNEIPVETLALNTDQGKTPYMMASGNSHNEGFRKSEIKRIKNLPIEIPSINAKSPKTERLLPIPTKIYPEPQLLSNANYQYSGSYRSVINTIYPMDAPKTLDEVDLSTGPQIQFASIALADTEMPDEDVSKPTVNQTIESNEYELVQFLFEKPNAEFGAPSKMAVDKDGNIYVSDLVNARIMKLSPEGEILASWGENGYDDGQFKWPCGIAVDKFGCIYVADSGNYRIQKFDSDGNFLTKWGSKGYVFGTENYKDPSRFKRPLDVAVDDSGYVYVVDAGKHCVCKFSSDGDPICKWGEKGSRQGQFRTPTSIAIDKSGNIYVADGENHRIQKFNSNGSLIAKWGTMGTSEGKFRLYCDLAIDKVENILVVDNGNSRIQKFDTNGKFLTKWGEKVHGYDHYWHGKRDEEPDDGFVGPSDIAIAENGDIYILDGWRIKVFRQKPVNPK